MDKCPENIQQKMQSEKKPIEKVDKKYTNQSKLCYEFEIVNNLLFY